MSETQSGTPTFITVTSRTEAGGNNDGSADSLGSSYVQKLPFSDTMTIHEQFLCIVKYATLALDQPVPTIVLDPFKGIFFDLG